MNLDEYQWSHNPRGMHWDLGVPNVPLLKEHQFGIVKLVTLGGPPADHVRGLIENNITPIVRVYRLEPGNAPADSLYGFYREHIGAGVKWFELYNEPNLAQEWPPGANFNPRELSVMGPLMDNWLNWAEFIIGWGGYPGLPALAEADGDWEYNGLWTELMLQYLHDNHFNRFIDVLNNGCYVATHPGVLNHFYQEQPGGGPLSVRQPHEQNMHEGGWHFEYPYDPINQRDKPGVGVFGSPKGEPIGLIAGGLAFMEKLKEMFGVGAIPVMGTEGGIFVPHHAWQPEVWDSRYPPYTWASHQHGVIAMFRWIIEQAPPWMFGVTLWTAREYWEHKDGDPPVLDVFRQVPPGYRYVPSLPAFERDPYEEEPDELEVIILEIPAGPGPVHVIPDYHFLYISPNVDAEYFFESAREYWRTFSPTLLGNLDFIQFLTNQDSLVLTLITSRGDDLSLTNEVLERWPNVRVDVLIADRPAELAAALQERVIAKSPYG